MSLPRVKVNVVAPQDGILGRVWPWTIGRYHVGFWTNMRSFVREARHGRPCICHSCGQPMVAGQWVQRVRVPATPWTMWRHRSLPCGPGRDRDGNRW